MLKRPLVLVSALCALLCAVLTAALAEDADTYYIEVDLASQITTVYRSDDGTVVRQMICSTGTDATTPRGSFQLAKSRDTDRKEWYWISEYRCFVKYPTRIQGHILFHSLPYATRDMASLDKLALEQLGSKASHGCVRLRWRDAEWIALNCPDGTATRIFTGTSPQTALRELLLLKSYTGAGGVSYDEFIASIAPADTLRLRYGDSGGEVTRLQRRLGAMGYYSGPVTGEFDARTIAAVTRCQTALGLWATGAVDRGLWNRLFSQ